MQHVAAVIFDLDGCLVDSEPLSLEALAAEMRAVGLPDARAENIRHQYLGVSLTDIQRDIREACGCESPTDFADRIERRLFAAYARDLRPIDGAVQLVDRLETAGFAVAIATGGSLRRMRETLRLGGLAKRFDGRAFSAEEVPRGKPHPDLFLHAAAALGIAPAACAVLEDSPHGILGAKAAGMRAVGFVGGSHLAGIREFHADSLRAAGATDVVSTIDAAFVALTRPRVQHPPALAGQDDE